MITVILLLMLVFSSCAKTVEKTPELNQKSYAAADTLHTSEDVQSHKNQDAVIKGRIQKFTPWTRGKGAGVMYWDWEIALRDGEAFPIISIDSTFDIGKFENKNVVVHAKVFLGTIIGDDNEGHQSASGYRIDAENIFLGDNLDTCRNYPDLESHQNQDAFIEGRLIEYIPPHDSTKLGDEKIWNWEIVLSDKYKYPLISKNSALDVDSFIGKNVVVKGKVFSGIIFGYENTANIRGIRIDAEEIYLNTQPKAKIMFELDEFTYEGLRERPKGEFSTINYEFCIPANDETLNEVRSIDPTVDVYKNSKGRSGCTNGEWLCIGSSRQAGFKEIILELASLKYIRQINETFWE